MTIELDPIEQRVLGSLLEKERTVPDTYPMTLKGLTTACNQSSGRDPVLDVPEHEVLAALGRLRGEGLTRILHPSHGARQPKHRQVLDEVLLLDDAERAVLTVLLLRGPQTPGELRSRSERLHPFTALAEVERALATLRDRDDPLVEERDRSPGQKERRWAHRLGPLPDPAASPPPTSSAGTDHVLAEGASVRDARVVATYDTVATAYANALVDELDGKPFDRWLLERLVDLADGGPVADVGCGPGHVAAYLAIAGADVTGFDLAPGMVAEARRRFPEVAVEEADLRDLPEPPGGWGAIAAWYSLVHLATSEVPDAVVAMSRRLRPGGWLAVAVHAGDEVCHLDDWFGHPVGIDFTLHERGPVVAAFTAAGLVDLECYLRSHAGSGEAPTERLYVLGRSAPA
jgi:uncharacterized protein YceH (UPF0502 family)